MQSECEEGVSEGNEGLDVERSAAGQPDTAGWCCGPRQRGAGLAMAGGPAMGLALI